MQPELRDLGDAASLVVERLAAPVQGMHRVISDRVFRYVGPPGAPVKAMYDSIVGGVYQGIRRGSGIVGSGVGAMLATRSSAPNPVSESRAGSGVQAALNAVWGDQLVERENRLAVGLSVRAGGRALTVDGASLAAAYPNAGRHVVVLLHGLGQTERCWQSSHPDGSGLFETLAVSPDVSPVLLRYNSGLSVDRSGEDLSHLLGALVDNWPIPDARVSLVGYSMGGLVARRAYAAGVAAGHDWTGSAGDLVSVGAPHHGSPVARGVRLGSWALGIAKTSRPLGDFLETASAGIKDLRDGAGVAEAWAEIVTSSPADSAGIRQHFVAAVVTGDVRHPFGVLVGDLVVRVASATGPAVAPENVHILSRRRHFDILSDVAVNNQILDWLRVATPGN